MTDERILLHVCCAPCSMNVIEVLKDVFQVELFFYNPNIYPVEEYNKRKREVIHHAEYSGLIYYDQDYHAEEFYSQINGLEKEKEGGSRCRECFRFRLEKTAWMAQSLSIPAFTTTLTVSPHKNSQVIFDIALAIAEKSGVRFIQRDFKKQDGFKKSMMLAKSKNIYIQNYCGCEFSLQPSGQLSLAKKK